MTRYAAPLAIGLIGIAILLWLGTWQIQRLAWKEAILDDIAQTIAGPSQPLPAPGKADPVTHRYQPVTLQGDIGDKALHVLVSVKRQGPGWRAISRLTVQDDRGATRHLLLDRGFVPVADKGRTAARRAVTLTGNLHWPDDRNSSTPDNDVDGDTWFARDIPAMAAHLGTEPLLVILRDMTPPDAGVTPLPVDTSGIPNDHLQYAITWYALATVWLTMTGVWIWRRRTGKEA